MVEAEYSRITKQFTVQIRGLGLNKGICIPMKFDTGAINTVISLKRLICGKANAIKEINEYMANRRNVVRKTFYYYIIIDGERDISLLGNDFISACDFKHQKFQSIKVDYFNEQAYSESFESQGVLTLDELSDIVNNSN